MTSFTGMRYDAFISYRHKQPDMRVAEKVQTLLEHMHIPKEFGKRRIGPIFRDKTELPTGNDLGESIRAALRDSAYLIVILSEDTKESKWCMEEIRYFKELHGGSVRNILPVLISGEPDEALPELLKFETAAGEGEETLREIEPLMCDIRADSTRKMLRKLKTEYLRLAAQIMGCAFDRLYQRQRRYQRRVRAAVTAGVVGLLSVTLAVISVFAYRTYLSEQRYQSSLVSQLVQRGAENNQSGESSQALVYYARALEIDPDNSSAAAGALAALQSGIWRTEGEAAAASEQTAGPAGLERFGKLLSSPEETGKNAYVYQDGMRLTLFLPEKDMLLSVDVPDKENPMLWKFETNEGSKASHRPYACCAWKDGTPGVAATYGGYVYFYTPISGEIAPAGEVTECKLDWEMDLAQVYIDLQYGRDVSLGFNNPIRVSDANAVAVIWDPFSDWLCTVDLFSQTVLSRAMPEDTFFASYRMHDTTVLAPDGSAYALFVEAYASGRDNNNEVHIIGMDGTLLCITERELIDKPVCLCYDGRGDKLLIVRENSVQAVDARTGEKLIPDIPVSSAASASLTENGEIQLTGKNGETESWRLVSFGPAGTDAEALSALGRGVEVYEKNGVFYSEHDAPSGSVYVGLCVTDELILAAKNDSSDPCLRLVDIKGQEVSRVPFPDPDAFYSVWVDAEQDVAYLTPDWLSDSLYRCVIDVQARKLGVPEKMDLKGMQISGGVTHFGGGCAVLTPDLKAVYYAPGALEPTAVIPLGKGSIRYDGSNTAAAGTGIAVLRVSRGDGGEQAEMWDLREGLCLGVLYTAESISIGNLANGQIWVRLFDANDPDGVGEERFFAASAPVPDQQAVLALRSLCDHAWSDSAILPAQSPKCLDKWGAWEDSIRPVNYFAK